MKTLHFGPWVETGSSHPDPIAPIDPGADWFSSPRQRALEFNKQGHAGLGKCKKDLEYQPIEYQIYSANILGAEPIASLDASKGVSRVAPIARPTLCSRRALRAASDFASAARATSQRDAIGKLLGEASRQLGFTYFALVHHGRLIHTTDGALGLHNYPDSWCEHFETHSIYKFDPVQAACRRQLVGFRWSDICNLVPLGTREREVLAESARHGIGPGFTVPLHLPGERPASCSFAVRREETLPEHELPVAQLLGQFGFEFARRAAQPPGSGTRPQLSPRQRECVVLMAQGKTDWEIGQILALSEETVTKYLSAARSRFDVSRRTQLAVAALRNGDIGFEEVLRD